MSILRYFNKHQGWHDGKRTPFGGGGGGFVSGITDSISGALGTDGGGGGLLGGLADIDPGPAIGGGLAQVDKAVNQIPGGWYTVGGLAAGGTALAFAPEIAAAIGAEAGTTLATEAGQAAFFDALAGGATGSEALGIGLVAEGGAALTPEMIAYANASADPIGSINAIAGLTPEEFASYTQIIGSPTSTAGFTAGQDLAQLMQSHPNLTAAQLEDIMMINYGTDPMLAADAANLAANGYDAATIDQVLGYSYNASELAGTGIESVAADSAAGINAKDVLKNLSRAKSLANLLGGDSAKLIKAAKMPTAQQWTQQAAQNFAQATPEQFGGLYQMNQNPFTFSNPLAAALKGKDATGLDVSGTSGQALNTQNQTANLLRTFA
jgi:hypothetical protein